MYLFAKAKEEIGLDVAIEYQGKVLTGNSLVVSSQGIQDMTWLTAAEDLSRGTALFLQRRRRRSSAGIYFTNA